MTPRKTARKPPAPSPEPAAATETDDPILLWRRWSLLTVMRSVRRNSAGESEVPPESVRPLLSDLMSGERTPRDPWKGRGATVDAELREVERRLAASKSCPVARLAFEARLSDEERRVAGFLLAAAICPLMGKVARKLRPEMFESQSYDPGRLAVAFVVDCLSENPAGGEGLRRRRLFHPAGRLVESGVVEVSLGYDSSEEPDIGAAETYLHPRTVNRLLGDNVSYAGLSRGVVVERPSVAMDEVVLEPDAKRRILDAADAWNRRRLSGAPGEALAMLLWGRSGTGKTLLARALARHLDVPLIQLGRPDGGGDRPGRRGYRPTSEDVLAFVLREAESQGGIAFIDECDDLFRNDTDAGRALLLELERYRSFAILATNSPQRLDPALDRRMTLRVPFPVPAREERERIWRVHLAKAGVRDDGAAAELAASHFFTGGFIANAVRLAALKAERPDRVGLPELLAAAEDQTIRMADDFGTLARRGPADFPPMDEVARGRLVRLADLVRAAYERDESLWIQLSGPCREELERVAGAVARRAGMGIATVRLGGNSGGGSEGSRSDARRSGDPDPMGTASSIESALPRDVALAVTGLDDSVPDVPRSGIRFHLRALPGDADLARMCDVSIRLEPPAPSLRAELWRKALAGTGLAGDAEALARAYDLRPIQIERLAARVKRTLHVEGRDAPAPADFARAHAEEFGRKATPPLFSDPLPRPDPSGAEATEAPAARY